MADNSTLEEMKASEEKFQTLKLPLLLLGVTAVAYVYSYEYQRSYLSYFGIPEDFTIIDLTVLASSGSTFLLMLFIGYVTLGVLPQKLPGLLSRVLYLFFPFLMSSLITFQLFMVNGFAWGTLFFGFVTCFTLVMTGSELLGSRAGIHSLKILSVKLWTWRGISREVLSRTGYLTKSKMGQLYCSSS